MLYDERKGLCMGCMSPKADATVCPYCGNREDSPVLPGYLAPKTVLSQRYVIGKVLSYNGEGATYMGFDLVVNAKVTVREYYPDSLATRENGSKDVKVIPGCETHYKALVADFLELSKMLIKMKAVSSIIPVIDIFTENKTAYAVYEYVEGVSLREYLTINGGELTWDVAKTLFYPLLAAISAMHSENIIHRGISPDTIIMTTLGKLKLTGFCISAVRTARTELTPEIFGGYAAPEQYNASIWQGQWTDVYSIAATLFKVITGTMPPEANSRSGQDNLLPAMDLNNNIPKNVSNALFTAMNLSPDKRTQSMEIFINQLSSIPDFAEDNGTNDIKAIAHEKPEKHSKSKAGLVSAMVTGGILLAIVIPMLIIFSMKNKKPPTSTSSSSSTTTSSQATSSKASTVDDEKNYSTPNLVGMQIDVAIQQYKGKFDVIEQERVYNDIYLSGYIIEQTPLSEAPIEFTGKITVKVSNGPKNVPLPDLIGKNIDVAEDNLKTLKIQYETVDIFSEEYSVGEVVMITDFETGDNIDAGAAIDVSTQKIKVYVARE